MSTDKHSIAGDALSNFAKALVGTASAGVGASTVPPLGFVTKVFGDTLVDVVKSRAAERPDIETQAELVRFKYAAQDMHTLKRLILELAGISANREPIEELAVAVGDPEGIRDQELLRQAMERVFDRAGRATSDLNELAEGLRAHETVTGDSAVGFRDPTFSSKTTFIGGTHYHPGQPADATTGEDIVRSVSPAGMPHETEALSARPSCPYPGMVPFDRSMSDLFFGRGREIDEICRRLRTHATLLVLGSSGSGKTSLLHAGVIPKLESQGKRVNSYRPTDTALDADCDVLVIDQLEELFSVSTEENASKIEDVILDGTGPTILAAMRADFFQAFLSSRVFERLHERSFRLQPLGVEALRSAIVEPSNAVGVTLDPALVERLLADACPPSGEPGLLPHVQEALVLLWDKVVDHWLPLSAYRALGEDHRNGLQVAMSEAADGAVSTLSPSAQGIVMRILLRLIQFGEGRLNTRRRQYEHELRSLNDAAAEFDAVLQHLIDHRLLTAIQTEPSRQIEYSHEALISGWPRLQTWVDQYGSMEQQRRMFENRAQVWISNERAENALPTESEIQILRILTNDRKFDEVGFSDALGRMSHEAFAKLDRIESPERDPGVWDLQRKIEVIDAAGSELMKIEASTVQNLNMVERIKLLEEKIVHYVLDLLNFENFEIRLLDQQSNQLELVIAVGISPLKIGEVIYAEPTGNGISGYVAATGGSYICPNVRQDPHYREGLDDAASSLTVPLRLHDRVIGVFNIESNTPAVFDENDRQFAEIFGRYIAMAMDILDLLVVDRYRTGEMAAEIVLSQLNAPLAEIAYLVDLLAGEKLTRPVRDRVEKIIHATEAIRTRVESYMAGPRTILGIDQEMRKPELDPGMKGKKVLIAEGEAIMRETLSQLLTQRGCIVTSCGDGVEAIEAFEKACRENRTFDLVISEIGMPDRSGYEIFQSVKRLDDSIPVIFLTGFGYDPHHSVVRASQEGLHTFLFKPFQVSQLIKAMANAFEQRGGS